MRNLGERVRTRGCISGSLHSFERVCGNPPCLYVGLLLILFFFWGGGVCDPFKLFSGQRMKGSSLLWDLVTHVAKIGEDNSLFMLITLTPCVPSRSHVYNIMPT